jgi:PAT family beta-lactamase induction signal transducer AmpG
MTGPAETDTPPKRNLHSALAVFIERQTLAMMALGFAAGLPNLLIFDTLSAWLRDAGLSLGNRLFNLTTLAYSFKFLWAPLISTTIQAPPPTAIAVLNASLSGPHHPGPLAGGGHQSHDQPPLMALFASVGFRNPGHRHHFGVKTQLRARRHGTAIGGGHHIHHRHAGAAPPLYQSIAGALYAIMAGLMALGIVGCLTPKEKRH